MVDFLAKHNREVGRLKREIIFRPNVHGILIENDRALLQRHEQSELWYPPGLALEAGQRPAVALSTHFRALAQFTAEVGPLLFIEEQHQVGEKGQRSCYLRLYFLLKRPPGMVATLREGPNGGQPTWIPLGELSREQMQFGYTAVQAGSLCLQRL